MTPTPDVQERIRRYLLKQLAEEPLESFEKEILTNNDLFEELLIGEDELIDDYLLERLSEVDRTAFENHFLITSERQEKLRFGRALNRRLKSDRLRDAHDSRPHFFRSQKFLFRAAAMTVVLLLVAGTLWYMMRERSSPQTFATLNLSLTQGNRSQGPTVPVLKLPLSTDALKLVLSLPEGVTPAARYRAELEHDAKITRPLEIGGQDDKSVTAVIPVSDLEPGQYAVRLFTIRDGAEQRIAGSYLFMVE